MALYQFVMRSDVKRTQWEFLPDTEVEAMSPTPMFSTVLKLTGNPRDVAESGSDPNKVVKYIGPMHFDLDNASDIPSTLVSGRELFEKMQKELGVPAQYISIYLSGKKGLHFTIPESVFGVTKPIALLPLVWKYVAERMQVTDLDMNIYSMGMGRMWRNCNVKRKEGTYKVPITAEELMTMDEQQYHALVAAPRTNFEQPEVPFTFTSSQAVRILKEGVNHAKAVIKKQSENLALTLENAEDLPEVPGCIHKLITEGDCSESNYNQAAMQLASWIAVRFDRDDSERYNSLLVEPFLENVTSSTRGTLSQRREHLHDQLNRAFHGHIPFTRAAVVATIGAPCHNCPICRPDLFDEGKAEDAEDEFFDPNTKIKEDTRGFWRVTNTAKTQLLTFRYAPHTQYNELRAEGRELVETKRLGLVGTLTDDEGRTFENVNIPEEAWRSRVGMLNVVQGNGTASVFCSDSDLTVIARSVLTFYPLGNMMTNTFTEACGFYMEKLPGGAAKPHYVEAAQSITAFGLPSRFKYHGPASHVPNLLDVDPIMAGDEEAITCIKAIVRMNEQHNVAVMLGWLASNFFREHYNFETQEYPSVNVSGNSGAGKSATTRLLCKLSGLDYNRAGCEPLNLESSTLVPLHQYLSNSTTVVRLVEEANETQMRRSVWSGFINVVKSAWDRTSVSRGTLGTGGKGPGRIDHRISAPLMFISEQKPTKPAIQERCLSVLLSKRGRETEGSRSAFMEARATSDALYRMGRKLLDISMVVQPSEFDQRTLFEQYKDIVPEQLDDRPRFSYMVVMKGLDMLSRAFEEAELPEGAKEIGQLKHSLVDYLNCNRQQIAASKRLSECDLALRAMNAMSADPESRTRLKPGIHYYRVNNDLKLNLDMCLPQLRKFCNEVGQTCVFQTTESFGELLQSEPYFDRMEPDAKTLMPMCVLNIQEVQKRGIRLNAFIEFSES